ncbi:MAG: polysaccharide deacetylase family protein [Microthrixaceae bacterium]
MRGKIATAPAALVTAMVATACIPIAMPTPGLTSGALGGAPGQVALTFDDGPDPTWTPRVLDVLDRYGVKATFFVLGSNAARYPDLVREIVARGHSLGNHTWSHPDLTRLSGGAVVDQLRSTSDVLAGIANYEPSCARPPYRATNAAVQDIIASLGMRPALWNVDTNDYQRPGAGVIARRALAVRPDGVILMHDGGGDRSQTVAALPAVIEGIQARGWSLTKLCDSRNSAPPAAPAPAPTP